MMAGTFVLNERGGPRRALVAREFAPPPHLVAVGGVAGPEPARRRAGAGRSAVRGAGQRVHARRAVRVGRGPARPRLRRHRAATAPGRDADAVGADLGAGRTAAAHRAAADAGSPAVDRTAVPTAAAVSGTPQAPHATRPHSRIRRQPSCRVQPPPAGSWVVRPAELIEALLIYACRATSGTDAMQSTAREVVMRKPRPALLVAVMAGIGALAVALAAPTGAEAAAGPAGAGQLRRDGRLVLVWRRLGQLHRRQRQLRSQHEGLPVPVGGRARARVVRVRRLFGRQDHRRHRQPTVAH